MTPNTLQTKQLSLLHGTQTQHVIARMAKTFKLYSVPSLDKALFPQLDNLAEECISIEFIVFYINNLGGRNA